MILECFVIIAIICLILAALSLCPRNFPPGPRSLPVLGNILFDDARIMCRGLNEKYGSFAGFHAFFLNVVIVSGWEGVKELFTNEDCQGRPDVRLLRDRFKDGNLHGILFNEGETWKAQRRFVLHTLRSLGAFTPQTQENIILEEILSMIRDIQELKGRPLNFEKLFPLFTLSIIWNIVSSRGYSYVDPNVKEMVKGVDKIIHDIQVFGSAASVFPIIRHLFPEKSGYKSIKEGSQTLREYIEEAIVDLKITRQPGNPRNVIDAYLDKIDEEEHSNPTIFNENELVGDCMDLILAGTDTTAGSLCFAFLFLCVHQDAQERIFQEIEYYVGLDSNVTMEWKPKFIYTEAFLLEVARFRSISPVIAPRRATRKTTIGGYDIPKGTILFPHLNSILYDKDYWGDPETFRPDRFINEEGKIHKKERMLTFGKGKRSCLGENLSRMTMFLLVTNFLQRFKFKLPEGVQPNIESKPGFTWAPYTYPIIATPRN